MKTVCQPNRHQSRVPFYRSGRSSVSSIAVCYAPLSCQQERRIPVTGPTTGTVWESVHFAQSLEPCLASAREKHLLAAGGARQCRAARGRFGTRCGRSGLGGSVTSTQPA